MSKIFIEKKEIKFYNYYYVVEEVDPEGPRGQLTLEEARLIKPKANTIAEKYSDVGTYDIYIDGGDAENYSFAYNSGTLTIEKANQTITWEQEFDDLEKAYYIYYQLCKNFTYSFSYFTHGETRKQSHIGLIRRISDLEQNKK